MIFEKLDFLESYLKISKQAFVLFSNSQGRATLPLYIILVNRCEFLGFYKFKPKVLIKFFNLKDNKTLLNWLKTLKSLNLINFEYSQSTKTYKVTIEGIVGRYPDFSNPNYQKYKLLQTRPNMPIQPHLPYPTYPTESKKRKQEKIKVFFSVEESELMEEIKMNYYNKKLLYKNTVYIFEDLDFNNDSNEFRFIMKNIQTNTKFAVSISRRDFMRNNEIFETIQSFAKAYYMREDEKLITE